MSQGVPRAAAGGEWRRPRLRRTDQARIRRMTDRAQTQGRFQAAAAKFIIQTPRYILFLFAEQGT